MQPIKRGLLMVLAWVTLLGASALPLRADCPDGTTGDDVINCTTDAPPGSSIDAGLGSDTVTVDAGVTAGEIGGDSVGTMAVGNGQSGNDSITNNGTLIGSIVGDFTDSNTGGSDVIVNNGQVGGSIYGDYQPLILNDAVGGDDTIINTGTIGGSVYGDYVSKAGGNDTIINTGTVEGDINGDFTILVNDQGDDTITNSGTVNGSIDGGYGSDTVTLTVGSTVGGTISGSQGTDTLIFAGTTSDVDGFNQIQGMVGCNPCAGTITLDGKTYTFDTFEALKNLLILLIANGYQSIDINWAQRLNRQENGAPLALYCTPDSIIVVDIGAGGQGGVELRFALNQLPAVGNQPVVLGTAADNQLILQPDGTLLAVGPSLDGSKTYALPFSSTCTLLAAGTES